MIDYPQRLQENYRTANDPDSIRRSFLDNLYFIQARFPKVATHNDYYLALAWTVRDRLLRRWIDTASTYYKNASRSICYLSAEYLPGPHLRNALLSQDIEDKVREALSGLGLDLDELADQEPEPGLGNGGLGRLAACYLDSLATLEIPCIAYGIRYEFGIFEQNICDGHQIEITDKWLRLGNAWEISRPEIAFEVCFGGHTERYRDSSGQQRVRWVPEQTVKGVAYDSPIPGYKVATVNLLRLWRAEACESFDFSAFNQGNYQQAVEEKIASETISKVLYPNDEPIQGQQLRLQQQYFFASCAMQDMLRIFCQQKGSMEELAGKFAIQLNDTHPSVAIAELIRLLLDVHGLDWDTAWSLATRMFGYTNHTLLPEALETWPVDLIASILPRHLEIIYEINHRFLDEIRARWPNDTARVARMSLIDETGGRKLRMAHLATVASHTVNGVAELHSRLLRESVLRDFAELYPDRFTNVTNGITPRRFIALANPGLASLITNTIGDGWLRNLEMLRELESLAESADFRSAWQDVKLGNKRQLAQYVSKRENVVVDPNTMFDIQVKRFHEYKRQHLNILHIISQYLKLKEDPDLDLPARTWFFGGKAAPGYFLAKQMIELVLGVAKVINNDRSVRDRMRVAFLSNFNVKNSELIYPAADLSEQISTAGKEASGTGNMKFALNGALTIGTLDGANIEIRDAVGTDNFFHFGLTDKQVAEMRTAKYRPRDYYETEPDLQAALDAIAADQFSGNMAGRFTGLVDELLNEDRFFILADFSSYAACQRSVDEIWRHDDDWTRMSILNTARCGRFSSDRAIREYCERIWQVTRVQVPV